MSAERLHRLIGRALTDPRFRERLLQNPAEAVRGLRLTSEERSLVTSLRASNLVEFSRQLAQRLHEAGDRDPAGQDFDDTLLASHRL